MELRLNSGFFILSFCRSVKESIKESAFERRQELPAGTVAAPLCQPLKFSADYRDVTATLKMKRLRRLCGERRTFAAVAASFRRKRRREEGLGRTLSMPPHRNTSAQLHNGNRAARVIPQKNFFIMSSVARKPFSYIFICEANKNIDQAKEVRTHRDRGTFGV